jgi:tetratricopeptide (TPR) repeat protein
MRVKTLFLVVMSSLFYNGILAQNLKAQLNQCAVDCQLEHNYEQAISFFSDVIRLFPTDSIAYMDRGIAREEQKDLVGAIADFSLQIAVDSMSADSYFLRAMVKEKMGNDTGAIADYLKVSYWDDGNADAHFFRGLLRLKALDFQGAMVDIQQALVANPEHGGALAYRGWLTMIQGNFSSALHDIDSALLFEPHLSRAYLLKGSILAEQGEYALAFESIVKAFELDTLAQITYLRFPTMNQRISGYKKIAESALLQQTNATTEPIRQQALLQALIYIQCTKQAEKQIASIAQRLPISAQFFWNKAHFYELKRDLRSAQQTMNDVCAKFPTNYLFQLYLAEISWKLGDRKSACAHFQQYKQLAPLVDATFLWQQCK